MKIKFNIIEISISICELTIAQNSIVALKKQKIILNNKIDLSITIDIIEFSKYFWEILIIRAIAQRTKELAINITKKTYCEELL